MKEFWYPVGFRFNGENRLIMVSSDIDLSSDSIKNDAKFQAEGCAIAGIKLWMEENGVAIPSSVSKVRMIVCKEFEWDNVVL